MLFCILELSIGHEKKIGVGRIIPQRCLHTNSWNLEYAVTWQGRIKVADRIRLLIGEIILDNAGCNYKDLHKRVRL